MSGIPYKGSKRKIAPEIIDFIVRANPTARYFYDLFRGGGAVAFEALKRKQFAEVHYNELNAGVVALMQKLQTNGVTDEFYQWVSRESFFANKDRSDWFGGLVKTVWSFGNSQNTYLYGKEKEPLKKIAHDIIVSRCADSAKQFNEYFGTSVNVEDLFQPTVNERRLALQRFLTKEYRDWKDRFKGFAAASGYSLGGVAEHLDRVQRLSEVCGIDKSDYLGCISDHLGRVQRLSEIELLPKNFPSLKITNLSYEEVAINTPVDETVIYCDIPYKGTSKYQEDAFCHDKFLEWCKASKYKIYVSSYHFDLPCVLQIDHRSTLSATANNKVTEKLFCNKKEEERGQMVLF